MKFAQRFQARVLYETEYAQTRGTTKCSYGKTCDQDSWTRDLCVLKQARYIETNNNFITSKIFEVRHLSQHIYK